MVGWLSSPPKVVSGERLILGDIQSTPVARVSFLPGPEPPDRLLGADALAQPWTPRSLLGGQRH